jgi:hypothetical protein
VEHSKEGNVSKRTRCRLGHANPTTERRRRQEREPRRDRAYKAKPISVQKEFMRDIASISHATGLTFTEQGIRQVCKANGAHQVTLVVNNGGGLVVTPKGKRGRPLHPTVLRRVGEAIMRYKDMYEAHKAGVW